jgi:hypothetical protein
LNVSRTWFYENYPVDTDNYNTIKQYIDRNKISRKQQMMSNWFLSDAPTLQIGLMKLLGTQDERDALNNNVTIKAPEKETTEFEVRTGLYDD